jgi:hypothetical protein
MATMNTMFGHTRLPLQSLQALSLCAQQMFASWQCCHDLSRGALPANSHTLSTHIATIKPSISAVATPASQACSLTTPSAATMSDSEDPRQVLPNFIHLVEDWNLSGSHRLTSEAVSKRVKATWEIRMAQMREDHLAQSMDLRAHVRELTASNASLRDKHKATAARLEEANEMIWTFTQGGKPGPADPCSLCGRVGQQFVEEEGERVKPVQDEEDRSSADSYNKETARHILKSRLANSEGGWKEWNEGPGSYTLKTKDAPYHHERRIMKYKATLRKYENKMKEGDEELLAISSEEEREEDWKPAVGFSGMDDEDDAFSGGESAKGEDSGDAVGGGDDQQQTDSFW